MPSPVLHAVGPTQQCPLPEIPQIPEMQASLAVQAPAAIWTVQLPALQ